MASTGSVAIRLGYSRLSERFRYPANTPQIVPVEVNGGSPAGFHPTFLLGPMRRTERRRIGWRCVTHRMASTGSVAIRLGYSRLSERFRYPANTPQIVPVEVNGGSPAGFHPTFLLGPMRRTERRRIGWRCVTHRMASTGSVAIRLGYSRLSERFRYPANTPQIVPVEVNGGSPAGFHPTTDTLPAQGDSPAAQSGCRGWTGAISAISSAIQSMKTLSLRLT